MLSARTAAPVWALIALCGLAACSPGSPSGVAAPGVSPELIAKLGFDPSTLPHDAKAAVGKPLLPAGFSYKDLVEPHKYDDPDQVVLDPSGKYLYFITHLQYPDGSVYRIDLASGEQIRLTTGLQRPGGLYYYRPGNLLLVAEEGTGFGPEEGTQGFWRELKPDIADQPTPPPLRAMGQYRGEGMEVLAGDIFLTEDQPRGGHLYKFVPEAAPGLTKGDLYTFRDKKGFIKTEFLRAPDTGKEGTQYFAAQGLRAGPDGKLYMVISAETENRIVRVDPVSGRVSDFITTKVPGAKALASSDTIGFGPNGVLFLSGSGGAVYAALPSATPDGLSQGVYRFATGLGTSQGIAWSQDYSTLYLSGRGDADVIVAVTGFRR